MKHEETLLILSHQLSVDSVLVGVRLELLFVSKHNMIEDLDKVEVNDISTSRMEDSPDISEEVIVVCNLESMEEELISPEETLKQNPPLTFEDEHFFVTVQELDSLNDGDFSKIIPNEESLNSRLLMDVEIILDPVEGFKLLEEEDKPLEIMRQSSMHGYDAVSV